MAQNETVKKVKELLETNAYAPLKEAAEKWLEAADEKYGDKIDELKEKAAPAVADLKESVGDLKESVGEIKEKAAPKIDELKEKAAPAVADIKESVDDIKEKAAPKIDELKEKASPTVEELKTKAQPAIDKINDNEFVAKLKESVSTFAENIEFFGSKAGEEAVGKEAAEQIRKHAEEMKAQGKTYCDCPACTKAREILKELGEELED